MINKIYVASLTGLKFESTIIQLFVLFSFILLR